MFPVCILCLTFNHSHYIEDTLNGFVIQKTDFPFVAVILDDASTDNNQGVITDYLNNLFDTKDSSVAFREETEYGTVLFARHKTNENCFFAVVLLYENHYSQKKSKWPYYRQWSEGSKYIAICEGDDYWTDSRKLQMQADFLETHPDYSLCCHRFKIYHENTDSWSDDYVSKTFSKVPDAPGVDVDNESNFRTRFSQTLTLCYRRSSLDGVTFPPYKTGLRDFNFHYHLLKVGKGYCFADYMGVYRMHSGGVWASLSNINHAKVRLSSYQDLYQYNKDDSVVLKMYCEWLDRFYDAFVLSPFKRHKLTKNGVMGLLFAFGHYRRTQGMKKAISISISCIKAFFDRH